MVAAREKLSFRIFNYLMNHFWIELSDVGEIIRGIDLDP